MVDLTYLLKNISKDSIETLIDTIKAKDAYSGKEVADALKLMLDKQKVQDKQLSIFNKLIAVLAKDVMTTKQITNLKSNLVLLGKAFNVPWNANNLADIIDSRYNNKISKLPQEERYDALAKEIYAVYDIKNSEAAWHISYKIAGEFLAQETNKEIKKISEEL